MTYKTKLFLPLLFLFLNISTNVFSQKLLTIDDAIKTALENNYSINIAKNEKEIADNNFSIGNAGFLPSLDADGSYTKTTNNTKQNYLNGTVVDRTGAKSTNYTAGIGLTWTIFDGLKMFASFDRLKELKKVGETNLKSEVETNISKIISTYYDIVREQQVLEVLEQTIKISEERLRIAQDKKQLGSASKFDLLQAQVDLNEDKSSLLSEELKLKQAKILLNQLMGEGVNVDYNVADTILINESLSIDDLKPLTKEHNSDLIVARQNKNISDSEVKLARSDLFPIISLNAGYDFSKSSSEAGFVQSNKSFGYYYGATATFNIFNGLNTRTAIENSEISKKINALNLRQVQNTVDAQLSNSFEQYENSIKLVTLESENYKVAEENVAIGLERLKLGSTTPLEFRETQRQLINAKSRLVAAQFEAKNAETELLRISGQLVKDY